MPVNQHFYHVQDKVLGEFSLEYQLSKQCLIKVILSFVIYAFQNSGWQRLSLHQTIFSLAQTRNTSANQ